MNGMERRKLCCSISFHMVAITCVVWSLYVLIDRSYSHSCLCTWIKNMWQRIRIRILSTVYYQLLTFKNYSAYINLSSFQNQGGNSEWWATVAILDKISCGCNRFYRFVIHQIFSVFEQFLFVGGLVFMYIQCKVYIQICRKWRAYNRTIVVQVKNYILKTDHISNIEIGSSWGCDKKGEEEDNQ